MSQIALERGHGFDPALLVPGLPQVRAGRWLTGSYVLALWGFLLWVVVVRWDRVAAVAGLAPGGRAGLETAPGSTPLLTGPDGWIALLVLIGGLAGSWIWSARDGMRMAERGRTESVSHPGRGSIGFRTFRSNRIAFCGLTGIGIFCLLALLAPFLAPFNPGFQGPLSGRLAGPSSMHWLGTDHFARDLFSRLLYGARVSLSIGLLAVSISITLGTFLGAVAGYVGGWVDAVIMRFVDMVISFPALVLLISIVALFEPSIFLIIAVLGLTQWPGTTRIVRSEVLSLREREFIEAGRALGFSRARIILRHVIPNTLAPVIVAASLGIGDTIVLEAGLSFLGLGVQPPIPSWGAMVADGRHNLLGAWWIATFPGLAIVFTVLAFNLIGDGLRDVLDPRLRR